jgi:hypothetical protein
VRLGERVEEIQKHLEAWVGTDYLNALCSGMDPRSLAMMVLDAACQPLWSTRFGALMCFSVLMAVQKPDEKAS